MLGQLELCEYTFSNVNFMNSKYRLSISGENLAYRLRYAMKCKVLTGFQSLNMNKIM